MTIKIIFIALLFCSNNTQAIHTRSTAVQSELNQIPVTNQTVRQISCVLDLFTYKINHSERFAMKNTIELTQFFTHIDKEGEQINYVVQRFLRETFETCAVENKQTNAYKLYKKISDILSILKDFPGYDYAELEEPYPTRSVHYADEDDIRYYDPDPPYYDDYDQDSYNPVEENTPSESRTHQTQPVSVKSAFLNLLQTIKSIISPLNRPIDPGVYRRYQNRKKHHAKIQAEKKAQAQAKIRAQRLALKRKLREQIQRLRHAMSLAQSSLHDILQALDVILSPLDRDLTTIDQETFTQTLLSVSIKLIPVAMIILIAS